MQKDNLPPVYGAIDVLVGNTPLIELKNVQRKFGLECSIFAKLEYYNPSGSVKDRAVLQMLKEAENNGKIDKNSVIIEATSGNFGISLAATCAVRGLKCIIVMPANMSAERIKTLKFFGAEVILTDPAKGMGGAVERARGLEKSVKYGIVLGQFENKANAYAHFATTAPEIWEALEGRVDCLFAGAGTGGTLSGCYRFFKRKNPQINIFAVEPSSSPVLSGGRAGAHGIQGIGAGFIPKLLEDKPYDGVYSVSYENSVEMARTLARTEGVFAGLSSGAALHAAVEYGKSPRGAGKTIAVILPDGGWKYLSVF